MSATAINGKPCRFITVDAAGVPTTRDIPVYNLAGVLREHQRTIRKVAA
ncbi:hypothetical protein [Sphingomonas sp. SRS2]|nr:hypothetical protein [Sphingomonas sp. SRS2]